MTTRQETRILIEASHQTVTVLREIGATYVAERIERCRVARRQRVHGQRHWTCRGAGCPWCVRALIARWERNLFDAVGYGPSVSTVVFHVAENDGDLRDAVRTVRRTLRDMRDRAGRRDRAWRALGVAGMLVPTATGRVVLLRVRHDRLSHDQVAKIFERRWTDVTVSIASSAPSVPTIKLSLPDRVALALLRRGVEPLRIVVAPQRQPLSKLRHRQNVFVPPMPILV